ncbi:23S rRNA (guanosine(2251)-2'-O)-methyltransferase RlmB [Mangrovitalea sediminis]|uniref:23S rRNA (guanosine(2251)-2'-O)-methyltransferase RlmB n=1 Tax=Mangrovitalea sediminis TaxID=1982043 RepID=UPI000BE55A4D|nr:23S rRNA (guanosine(2251)-2'-O)-methyltransferase RlmB [Mangrovitalea sediminis]
MSVETVFGWHAVSAVLGRSPERIRQVWLQAGRDDARMQQLVAELDRHDIACHWVSRRDLDERVEGAHQGVVAEVEPLREWHEGDLTDWLQRGDVTPFLLILDGVTDPHNLGACLRTADAAGVHAVIVPKDKSAPLNPAARKVACGAAETVPLVRVTNLARCLRELKDAGVWLIGTAGEVEATLYDLDLKGPLALVMGAEGKGMRRLTREHCDHLAQIPMQGTVDSLNVSVATGVCLYEAVRQRRPSA